MWLSVFGAPDVTPCQYELQWKLNIDHPCTILHPISKTLEKPNTVSLGWVSFLNLSMKNVIEIMIS